MKVTIVGAGRLGTALAARSLSRGHETRILVRSFERTPAALLGHAEIVDKAWPDGEQLILLAAPGFYEEDAEARLDAFLVRAAALPVASAVAYPEAGHSRWSAGRSYARFLCTPAVAVEDHAASLILLPDAGDAAKLLLDWFGPATVESGDAQAFEHNQALLMATTLHLALIEMVLHGKSYRPGDAGILEATLDDAAVLMRATQHDAARALDRCATPKGETVRLTTAYRETLAQFIKALDNGGRD